MPKIKVNNAYIIGIEIMHKLCEIAVMEAPVVASPPNAWGKTIVFIPIGVATAKNNKYKIELSKLKPNARLESSFKANTLAIIMVGIITNLNKERI